MASTYQGWQPTSRDTEILRVLDVLPLTAEQLLKWSQRFPQPFPEIGVLRRRLRKLSAAGLLKRFPLIVASRGSTPYYYKLTPTGFRFLQQSDEALPARKRAFSPIGPGLHYHARALSDFLVQTAVAADHSGVEFRQTHPENAYRITVGDETLQLDGRFTLTFAQLHRTYNVELDNSTETLLSTRDGDSIGRKIRLLDAYEAQFDRHDPRRSVTLFITTRSRRRMQHILETAARLVRNPERALLYGVYLPEYLSLSEPLSTACFLDQRGKSLSLLPSLLMSQKSAGELPLAVAAAVC